jgi:hypothetical protein
MTPSLTNVIDTGRTVSTTWAGGVFADCNSQLYRTYVYLITLLEEGERAKETNDETASETAVDEKRRPVIRGQTKGEEIQTNLF